MTALDIDKVALTARDVSWDWTGLPLHYLDDDAFATHFCNGMNILLPEGEVFFVDVFSKALALAQDDAIREDVIGFIGQEATHSASHQALLDHLQSEGLDVAPYVEQIRRLLGDRDLTGRAAHAWLLERVALVAALEHFTSYLGDWGLNARAWDDTMDPRVLDLFRWHLAEEVEHRHVAFDLFTHLDGGYGRRVRVWLIAAPTLAFLLARGIRHLMSVDPDLDGAARRIRFGDLRRAWRRGLIPGPAGLAAMFLAYFRPGYHPSQYGSTSQAVAYLASSPAVRTAAHH